MRNTDYLVLFRAGLWLLRKCKKDLEKYKISQSILEKVDELMSTYPP